ncbi:MAG: hypothetical protein MUF49_27670 [Oculatellaceae cyanobacterium Prado106]|jgi:hypothetical protein|nr:hypothetical protein [Oculatellaceae cyanobacterium Prado106]
MSYLESISKFVSKVFQSIVALSFFLGITFTVQPALMPAVAIAAPLSSESPVLISRYYEDSIEHRMEKAKGGIKQDMRQASNQVKDTVREAKENTERSIDRAQGAVENAKTRTKNKAAIEEAERRAKVAVKDIDHEGGYYSQPRAKR